MIQYWFCWFSLLFSLKLKCKSCSYFEQSFRCRFTWNFHFMFTYLFWKLLLRCNIIGFPISVGKKIIRLRLNFNLNESFSTYFFNDRIKSSSSNLKLVKIVSLILTKKFENINWNDDDSTRSFMNTFQGLFCSQFYSECK